MPAATPDLVASRALPDARWWRREPDGRILCTLCPRFCRMAEGQAGFCFIRQHIDGRLVSLGYGNPAAIYADPIEKKPLFHFLPGTRILSMGTAGCNMGCKFCQNWDLSRAKADQTRSVALDPEQVPTLALAQGCTSVAFTYNEPTIFGEYVIDVARACRRAGVATVMVTNGYVTPEALEDIYPWIDAANVDLKAFTDEFYRKITLSEREPVLAAIARMRELGTWVELTTLLIPGLNDADVEIAAECTWILERLGPEVPVHFTAFHPDYKLTDRPATPPATLARARSIAKKLGLTYVYCGNVHDAESQTTWCPGCAAPLVRRDWHAVLDNRLHGTDACACGERIPGCFDARSSARSEGRRRSLMTMVR